MERTLNVAVLPSSEIFLNGAIFEKNKHRDDCLFFFRLFKELGLKEGFNVRTVDHFLPGDIDVLVFYRFDLNVHKILKLIGSNKRVKLVHVMHEPSTVVPFHIFKIIEGLPFDLQYILNDDVAEKSSTVNKICYGVTPILINDIPHVEFKNKKFITTISGSKSSGSAGELYSERERAIIYFANMRTGFDLYGMGWEKCNSEEIIKTYRGSVNDKKDTLKNYKFTLCFENTKGVRGYITEKIFDCFSAGSVPIYYGAPNIDKYIPKECYVDFRDFETYDVLYDFLYTMSESQYNKYLDAAKNFIESDDYSSVNAIGYVDTLVKGLVEIGNKEVCRSVLGFRFRLLAGVFVNCVFYFKNFKKMRRYIFELMVPTQ